MHKRITIGLTKTMYQEMDEVEEEKGIDKTNQAREALSEYLDL